jgi:hypothetical protein
MCDDIYKELTDDEFLLQGDVPSMLAHLKNGYGGKVTRGGLRDLLDTETRPSQIYKQIQGLCNRGFVDEKFAHENTLDRTEDGLLHLTDKGRAAPILDG